MKNSQKAKLVDMSARRIASTITLGLLLLAGGRVLTLPRQSQAPAPFRSIAYTLAMPRPASHLFEVSIDVEALQAPASVDFQMPKWQPGRYSVADFAQNVQEFSAKAGGQRLPARKDDDQTWRVDTRGNRSFTVTYKVFGNDLSGTYAQLDVTHGNYNGGEIFMYVAGHKQDPVSLQIRPPAGWRVINGASERANQTSWRYPNYEILIDNPTEVGPDWTLDEFNVGGKTYRVVVHSRGAEGDLRPNLVRDLEKIVNAEVRMWGPPDFEAYTFLLHFAGDTNSHDGMEHLTSAQIIRPGGLADPGNYARTLDNAAHEFFHAWNVKRLRPAELGPWDWTRPANTEGLWIAEGLTQYYGAMMLRRAGLWSDSELLNDIEGTIDDVENAPGNKLMSAVDASLAAPFIDGAAHRQRTNLDNTSVSYYTKGELIGVVLDLSIRGRTNGRRSLDDVLKQMYEECYLKAPNASYYLRGRGYTQADFVRILSEVSGTDMSRFYDRYVRGVETLPYDEAFRVAGLRLMKTPAETATAGLNLDNADRQNLRLGSLRPSSPAERAGLQEGDILVSIGGVSVTRGNWRSTLDRYRPGDRVTVQFRRFGETLDRVIELSAPVVFNYRLEEIPNASAEARTLRSAWLSGS